MLIKALLAAERKLFCRCLKNEGCEICKGMPGAAPALNKEAVNAAVKFAVAAKCRLGREISFFRSISDSHIIRYSSPVGTGGSFSGINIHVKEIWIEESPSGEALCAINTNSSSISDLKGILSYLGIYGGSIEPALNSREGIPDSLIQKVEIEKPDFPAPEFHWQKTRRWTKRGVDEDIAKFISSDYFLAEAFDSMNEDPKSSSSFFHIQLRNALGKIPSTFMNSGLTPDMLKKIFTMMKNGEISGNEAERMLFEIITRPKESEIIISRKNTRRITNEQDIKNIINKVMIESPLLIVDWRSGRESLGKVMTKVMQEAQGRADPTTVRRLLEDMLVGNH